MNEIQKWFEEARKTLKVFNFPQGLCIFYKGFKITDSIELGFIIEDVRYSNMYSKVSPKDYKTIQRNGFIKGVDIIRYYKDKKRIKSLTKKIEHLYTKRAKFQKELPKDRRINEKRIRNINKNIDIYLDHIFFYNTRINQFNSKTNE